MPTLSVQLVTWNGARYIPDLFACLREQTFHDWEFTVIDNGSTDGTVAVVDRLLHGFPVRSRVIRNTENVGFAAGHNQAFPHSRAPFVQLLNQDTVLATDYLRTTVTAFHERTNVGAVQGALLRWDWADPNHPVRTDTIDTLGLRILRNRRVVELGAGDRIDDWSFRAPHSVLPIFGVSGALAMYRRSALDDVAIDGEVFDENFFSYKEDIDLAYRLWSRGWDAFLVRDAVAWHDRTAAGPRDLSDLAARGHRTRSAPFVRYHSYKNHLAVLVKNEHPAALRLDWQLIAWYECKKLAYCAVAEPRTLLALGAFIRRLPTFLAKRRAVMASWRRNPEELASWFGPPPATAPDEDAIRARDRARCERVFDVVVVTVNYHVVDRIVRMLETLYWDTSRSGLTIQPVVVDNGSDDDIADILRRRFDRVRNPPVVLRAGGNLGFGRGNNLAFRQFPARYYFIANPDLVFLGTSPRTLERLYQFLEERRDVGIVAPRLQRPDGSTQPSCMRFPSFVDPLLHRLQLGSRFAWARRRVERMHMADIDHVATRPIDWAAGAALFVRGSFLRRARYFDERYWMYVEDCDLCRTFWAHGWPVYYHGGIVLQHTHERSSAKVPGLRSLVVNPLTRAHLRSLVRYSWKWRGR